MKVNFRRLQPHRGTASTYVHVEQNQPKKNTYCTQASHRAFLAYGSGNRDSGHLWEKVAGSGGILNMVSEVPGALSLTLRDSDVMARCYGVTRTGVLKLTLTGLQELIIRFSVL